MKTARRLFLHRLITNWKFQYSVWQTVVDWVVALYIVIPFSALFLHTYLGWWKEIPPVFSLIPLELAILVVLAFTWSGTLRIFVEDADQIFLFQSKSWIKALTSYSIAYHTCLTLLLSAIFCFVLAPFLILGYGFSIHTFLYFFALTFLLKATLSILNQYLKIRFRSWEYLLAVGICFIASGIYLYFAVYSLINLEKFFYFAILGLAGTFVMFIMRRLSLKGTLLKDISLGQAAKMKFANVLLRYTGTYTKKPIILRTRTWLFRNSEVIFRKRTPENVLIELCLKANLRHRPNLMFYFQVVGMYALCLSVFPLIWKWVLLGVSILLLTSLGKLFWLEWVNSPFVSIFLVNPAIKRKSAGRILFLLACPGWIFLTLIVALQTQQWLYFALSLPLGSVLGKLAAKKMAGYH